MKRKRRSCPMCKPHKTGGGNRWKARDEQALREFERSKKDEV